MQFFLQGSLRGSLLPEQAEPLPGAAWSPLEEGTWLNVGPNDKAWVSQTSNTHC